MIKEAITKIIEKINLTQAEIEAVMEEIMTGEALPSQIASFLTALRMKGETIDEITGCALVMRKHATQIKTTKDALLDTCGTGGDKKDTFNISTISAFIAAGAGLAVAKHGNRSVSSICGSADLLEALGVKIEIGPAEIEKCIEKVGIGFLFAPLLHGAMKYATPVRREIGIRTIFNILGPLSNPARATHQLLGVYDEKLTEPLARVLGRLGLKHALVVHGKDGLDEVSTTSETYVSEFKDGVVRNYEIKPEDFGIKRARLEDLKGGNIALNVKIANEVLNGEIGSRRDVVLLNAAFAIYAGDKALDIKEGVRLACESIDTGKALKKLEELKKYTNKCS